MNLLIFCSYYVDPSTIKHSLGSTTSSLDTTSSSSSASSGSGTSSNFIGTTLTMRANNSSSLSRPAVSSSAPLKLVGITKPNGNIPGSSGGLSGLVLPPPVVDPFSAIAGTTSSTTSSSAGASATAFLPSSSHAAAASSSAFARPTATSASSSLASVTLPAAPTSSSAAPSTTGPQRTTQNNAGESFANFDAAKFDSAADPWSASKKQPQNNFTASTSAVSAASNFSTTSTAAVLAPITNNQGTPNQHQQHPNVEINVDSVEDRYAALKDLDDIFKSTVVVNDVKSTGASIFGAASQTPSQQQQHGGLNPSPTVTALGASPSVFGPSPTNNLPPGQQSSHNPNNGGSVGGFESAFPTNWDNPAGNNHYRGSSPAGWASNWPNNSAASKNGGSNQKAPINPFTGVTNLSQLNTSPWPTTGTSPVQNSSVGGWPPINNAAANPGGFNHATTSGFGNPGFGSVTKNSLNDPFGAAPAANLQQSVENNNDLFAKAPFGSSPFEDHTISVLTQEIFGNVHLNWSNPMNNGISITKASEHQQGFNPWATPPASTSSSTTGSIFASGTKANPTNPFL
jgi:hypothetical protein